MYTPFQKPGDMAFIYRQTISWLLLLTISAVTTYELPSVYTYKIGGLFEPGEDVLEKSFIAGVRIFNNKVNSNVRLEPIVEKTTRKYDSLEAANKACGLLSERVVAIFGPQSAASSAHIGSVCENLRTPHIETRYKYLASPSKYTIQMFPNVLHVSESFSALFAEWKWWKCGLLYEYDEALIRMESLFDTWKVAHQDIIIRQLPFHSVDHYKVLTELRSLGVRNIIIDCGSISRIQIILKQAQLLGMITEGYHYFINHFDADKLIYDDFCRANATITFPYLPQHFDVHKDFQRNNLQHTSTAYLMANGVLTVGKALIDMTEQSKLEPRPVSCEPEISSIFGPNFIGYLKNSTDFSDYSSGVPYLAWSDFDILIKQVDSSNTFKHIATLNINGKQESQAVTTIIIEKKIVQEKRNHLMVATVMTSPYVAIKEGIETQDRYSGFCVDLLKEISKIVGFTYTLYTVPDMSYGRYDEDTGKWTGIIGQVAEKKADVGLADLAITVSRKDVVAFSHPYMHTGMSVLIRKPQLKPPHMFSFLRPFSGTVWFSIFAAFLGVGLLMSFLARFNHNEWRSEPSSIQTAAFLENQFSLLNSLWFSIGVLLHRGFTVIPRGMSTRLLAGTWLVFSILVLCTYLAHLIAFHDLEEMEPSITSIHQLVNQKDFKYGCVRRGATREYFKNSAVPLYSQMNAYMNLEPSVLVSTLDEGLQRVKEEKYALIMESATNDYITERECDLQRVGEMITDRYLGLALPKDSPYQKNISEAILRMQKTGFLKTLRENYWGHKKTWGHCDRKPKIESLGFSRIGGVFIGLIAISIIAISTAILEVLWAVYRKNHNTENMMEDFWKEVRFAFSSRNRKIVHIQPVPEEMSQLTEGMVTNN